MGENRRRGNVMDYVKLQIGEVYSKVIDGPARALTILAEICRARPKNYFFMPKYRDGSWDGYISLLRGMKTFPTGLLDIILQEFRRQEMHWHLEYQRREIYLPTQGYFLNGLLNGISLRDYQADATDILTETGRGIAKMATNAGKTVVFAALIKLLGNKNALIIVRSKDLLYQTSRRLADYLDRSVGLIGDSHRDEGDILVATVQTLNSLRKQKISIGKLFAENHILVIDEAHMVADNQTFDVLMQVPGWYRFGFSGTPLDRGKLNDLKLIACTGSLQVEVSNAELIEQEWSAKPIIFLHDVHLIPGFWNVDYQTAYDLCIVTDLSRRELVANVAIAELDRGSVLIIVSRIEHGLLLQEMIPDSIFVNGSSPVSVRQDVLGRLGRGDRLCCIATQIFDEGVDVPALDTLILAGGGKSKLKLLQRVGRGLRKKKGRNIVHIHDFLDGSNKYLLEHTEERVSVYKREGFDVRLEEEK